LIVNGGKPEIKAIYIKLAKNLELLNKPELTEN
jgi:hypothetical protein